MFDYSKWFMASGGGDERWWKAVRIREGFRTGMQSGQQQKILSIRLQSAVK
jgi:hypothetical protein